MGSSTVQVFSTELSILSIPPDLYTFFFHGITKLILRSWEDDYLPPSSSSSSIFKDHCIPPNKSPAVSALVQATAAASADPSDNALLGDLADSTTPSASIHDLTDSNESSIYSNKTARHPSSKPSSTHLHHQKHSSSSGTATSSATSSPSTPLHHASSHHHHTSRHSHHYGKNHTRKTSLKRLSSRADDFNSNLHSTDDADDLEQQQQQAIRDRIEELREFINISFTPVECSVICPTELVDLLFGQAFAVHKATILTERYIAIQVDIAGSNSGPNLIEITAPLSKVGIPIFFIPTYFSDYVVVPFSAKNRVTRTLEARGFVFSNTANSYVNVGGSNGGGSETPSPMSPAVDSPYASESNRNSLYLSSLESSVASLRSVSSTDSTDSRPPLLEGAPLSPYLASLGAQTIDTFRRNSVRPVINIGTKLLLTGMRSRSSGGGQSPAGGQHDNIFLSIVHTLIHPPDFFSITIVNGTEVSFIVNQETAEKFSIEALLGSKTDYVIPISFDFSNLPEDSTGIVAGVASQLYAYDPEKPFPQLVGKPFSSNGTSNNRNSTISLSSSIASFQSDLIQMSYLSTAKSGVVMVSEVDVPVATAALSVFMHRPGSAKPMAGSDSRRNSPLINSVSTDDYFCDEPADGFYEDGTAGAFGYNVASDNEEEDESDEEDYGDSNTSKPTPPGPSASAFATARLKSALPVYGANDGDSNSARPASSSRRAPRSGFPDDYSSPGDGLGSGTHNTNHHHHHHHHHSNTNTAAAPASPQTGDNYDSPARPRSKLSNNVDFDF